MKIHASGEDYLETILILHREMGMVRSVDVARSVPGFLKEDELQSFSPVEGVSVTAWGLIDGQLHIQAHYEDIVHTDNHGYICLKDEQGNEITYSSSISFWDEEQTGSYEEYIFDIDTEQAEYSVWGCFQSGSQLVKGSWKVAFFLNP